MMRLKFPPERRVYKLIGFSMTHWKHRRDSGSRHQDDVSSAGFLFDVHALSAEKESQSSSLNRDVEEEDGG